MPVNYFAVLFLCCTACYSYTPVQAVATNIGQPLRVQLTEQGSIDLAPMIGPTILTLDGTLASAKDTVITLSVTNAIARNGVETAWRGEPVGIPRSAVNGVQLRTLDKRRSWLAAAGGVGATIALGAAFNLLGGGFGGKNPPQNGGPR